MAETPIPTPDGLRRYADEMLADKPLTHKWVLACYAAWAADKARIVELRSAIDAMMRECGSEPDSRYARNACIIGAAARREA